MKQLEHIAGSPVFRILIPPEPRRYAGQRWTKVIARSTHVVLAGIFLGALVFDIEPGTRAPWFQATLLSGLLMVALDLYESGAFLLQLRGLIVAVKLLVLALLPVFGTSMVWVVAPVAFISVMSSHASGRFRYFLIWGRGRIKAAETKG